MPARSDVVSFEGTDDGTDASPTSPTGSELSPQSPSSSSLNFPPVSELRPVWLSVEDVLASPLEPVSKRYKVDKILAKGGFGLVTRVHMRKKKCGEKHFEAFAVKSVPLEICVGNCLAERELEILARVDHPNVVFLIRAFRDSNHLHLVTEIFDGGSLAHRIRHYWDTTRIPGYDECLSKGLPSSLVARYLWQILMGISYVHHHGIAHRDVKLDNCMFTSRSDRAQLKIIDFGSACWSTDSPMTEKAGTLHYAAPEVFSGSYDERCDIWSIGVVSFVMCVGHHPFDGQNEKEVKRLVQSGFVDFKAGDWKDLPAALRLLVEDMLTKDPQARPSAMDSLLTNTWLRVRGSPRQAAFPCSCTLS